MTARPPLTHISWRSTRRGHDVVVHHLGQAEIADHDLGVLVLAEVQDVLRLHTHRYHQHRFAICC